MSPPFPRFTVATPAPDDARIAGLWDEHRMLDHIEVHSEVVCAVALRLTDWLAEAGCVLVRRVVEAGALVHDLAKSPCLESGRRHDLEGERLLSAGGYPELGRLVGVHVRLPSGHPVDEAMVVYYADKRVSHDRVVDLGARYADIAERYGRDDPRIVAYVEKDLARAREVERLLFERIMTGASGRSPNVLAAVRPRIGLRQRAG